jgi:hypothetical protein
MKTIFLAAMLAATGWGAELTVQGRGFLLDGKPFPFTGISFFNAVHNKAFNESSSARREWMRKFKRWGINVFRVWGQWDNPRGFVDSCATCTLYFPDGRLRMEHVERLKAICADADAEGIVIEVVLFSQESWHTNIRVSGDAADNAVAAVTKELMPFRNVVIQIWNEFDERTLDHVKTVRSVDAKRLVTNSPGVAGVLTGMRGEEQALDFLTPHTTRQGAAPHWEIAPKEIQYLLTRFNKQVVDDEPARNGTPQFGGPKNATDPYDHILQIAEVLRMGAYIVYHHDMFQLGGDSKSIPPNGIPDPEFNPYHRKVLEFISKSERYARRP